MHLVSNSLPNSSQQGAAKKNRNGDSLLSKLLSPQTQVGGSMAKQAGAGIRQHQQGVAAAAAAATAVAVSMPHVGLSRTNIDAAQPCLSPPDLGFPRNIEDNYTWGPRLGKGGNGVVRVVTDKRTGTEYACKSIVKVRRWQGVSMGFEFAGTYNGSCKSILQRTCTDMNLLTGIYALRVANCSERAPDKNVNGCLVMQAGTKEWQ
jgi:hypothetical protein